MAFLKLAKLAVGGAASFIFLTGNTVKAQEILETNCENQTKKTERSTLALPQVYFILRQGNSLIGTIVMELRSDIVPKTAENFRKKQIYIFFLIFNLNQKQFRIFKLETNI